MPLLPDAPDRPAAYDAILFVSFGGPDGPDDVMPFLENVLRGRNVPRERMLEVAEHYQHFGGKSPINEQNLALIAALREGRLKGAALDVYPAEPAVPPALMHLENVVLLPHLGSATEETRTAMGLRVLANLDAFFSGDPLPDPVI